MKSFLPMSRESTYYGVCERLLQTYSETSSADKWGIFGFWNQSELRFILFVLKPILFWSKLPSTPWIVFLISIVPLKWIDTRVLENFKALTMSSTESASRPVSVRSICCIDLLWMISFRHSLIFWGWSDFRLTPAIARDLKCDLDTVSIKYNIDLPENGFPETSRWCIYYTLVLSMSRWLSTKFDFLNDKFLRGKMLAAIIFSTPMLKVDAKLHLEKLSVRPGSFF